MSKKKLPDGKKQMVLRIHGQRCFGCRFKFGEQDTDGHTLAACFVDAPVWDNPMKVAICQVCVGLLRGQKFGSAVIAAEFIYRERMRCYRTPVCQGQDFREAAKLIDMPQQMPQDTEAKPFVPTVAQPMPAWNAAPVLEGELGTTDGILKKAFDQMNDMELVEAFGRGEMNITEYNEQLKRFETPMVEPCGAAESGTRLMTPLEQEEWRLRNIKKENPSSSEPEENALKPTEDYTKLL